MPDSIEIPLKDLPPGTVKQFTLAGEKICVANADGRIYALSDSCTHAQISMSDGCLDGDQIVCPWHGAMFDLKTGVATCGPATDPLRCYKVTLQGQHAHIEA